MKNMSGNTHRESSSCDSYREREVSSNRTRRSNFHLTTKSVLLSSRVVWEKIQHLQEKKKKLNTVKKETHTKKWRMKEEDVRHVFKSTEKTQMKGGDMTLRSYGISKDVGTISFIEDKIFETLFLRTRFKAGPKRESNKREEGRNNQEWKGWRRIQSYFKVSLDKRHFLSVATSNRFLGCSSSYLRC